MQAFYNLINNAADFMPKGGTVTLRFALSAAELQIELEDTGTGIAPEIAERLRERKLANVARTKAQVVATGNVGCITQLDGTDGIRVVHTVELLDWATGGPPPRHLNPDTL